MTHHRNIPIQLEQPPTQDESAIARAVLDEIHVLLERLLRTGEEGSIDLRCLPHLSPEIYGWLREWLSVGEVSATLSGIRRSELQETAYPGVWWVTHRNEKDEIVTELIEVTEIPVLLKSQPDDIRAGLHKMIGNLPSAEEPLSNIQ